jgi:hypothetical protein
MTDDQQFILALAGIVSTTAIQLWAYRKAAQTHDLVNGMTKGRMRSARSAGASAQRDRDARGRPTERDTPYRPARQSQSPTPNSPD